MHMLMGGWTSYVDGFCAIIRFDLEVRWGQTLSYRLGYIVKLS
jgi:hypothetical protein